MILYLPNAISLLRIFISPIILFSISKDYLFLTLFLLSIGSLSDFFDGYFARKFNVVTKLGELLDPIADKIFSNTVLWGIYIHGNTPSPLFFLALILSIRDIVLVLGSIFVISKKLNFSISPIYASKICTTLIFLLAFLGIILGINNLFFESITYISLLLVFITMYIYVINFLKRA